MSYLEFNDNDIIRCKRVEATSKVEKSNSFKASFISKEKPWKKMSHGFWFLGKTEIEVDKGDNY